MKKMRHLPSEEKGAESPRLTLRSTAAWCGSTRSIFHISLNPHPDDKLTDEQLSRIDTVGMRDQRTFFEDQKYYSTLFHELVHSTGLNTRLSRHEKNKDHKFGSQDYSQEKQAAW